MEQDLPNICYENYNNYYLINLEFDKKKKKFSFFSPFYIVPFEEHEDILNSSNVKGVKNFDLKTIFYNSSNTKRLKT